MKSISAQIKEIERKPWVRMALRLPLPVPSRVYVPARSERSKTWAKLRGLYKKRGIGSVPFVLALAVASVVASAQSLHVTGVRDWQPTDAPRVSAVRVYVITGTLDGTAYTAQQMFSWGSQRFQPGVDYPATVSKDGRALNVTMQDKRGHDVKERLDVTDAQKP